MHPSKTSAAVVALVLAASGILSSAVPDASASDDLMDQAGKRIGTNLTRFEIGYLEPDTNEFVPVRGPGAQDCYRDVVLMFEFSTPIDLSHVRPIVTYPMITDSSGNLIPNPDFDPDRTFTHVDARTVRIGALADGIFLQSRGAFYRHVVNHFNPISGGYEPKRVYRDRVIFDPSRRFDQEAWLQNPLGLEPDTEYSVMLPGLDSGARRTVRSRSGGPLLRTYRTTFRTVDAFRPRVTALEATDLPGVFLEGRMFVATNAGIVATFSRPMLPSSFIPGSTFRVRDLWADADVPGTLVFDSGGTSCTFVADSELRPDMTEYEVTLARELRDLQGYGLEFPIRARFSTEFHVPASGE